jgi:hypothetical protein
MFQRADAGLQFVEGVTAQERTRHGLDEVLCVEEQAHLHCVVGLRIGVRCEGGRLGCRLQWVIVPAISRHTQYGAISISV